MSTAHDLGFVVINELNAHEVAKRLNEEAGVIIITEPQYQTFPNKPSGECKIHLLDGPKIDVPKRKIFKERPSKLVDGQRHQTNWEHDREYRLHKKRPPIHSFQKWFEVLNLENEYEFSISFRSCTCFGFGNHRQTVVYVPKQNSPLEALRYAVDWATNIANAQAIQKGELILPFATVHTQKILDYIMEDLRTGSVFDHNIKAGRDAEAMFGMT